MGEADGNITFGVDFNTRPVVQALNSVKSTIKKVFGKQQTTGVDKAVKQTNESIKQLEAELKKAEKELEAIFSSNKKFTGLSTIKDGEALLESFTKSTEAAEARYIEFQDKIKNFEFGYPTDTTYTQGVKELDAEFGKAYEKWATMQQEVNSMYNSVISEFPKTVTGAIDFSQLTHDQKELYQLYTVLKAKADELRATVENMQQNPELLASGQQLKAQFNELLDREIQLREQMDRYKMNPETVPEVQALIAKINELKAKIGEAQQAEEQASNSATRNFAIQNEKISAGLRRIEMRVRQLVRLLLGFSAFTFLRNQIIGLARSDYQLADSLAQIKGNLATAAGMVWSAMLPALRTLASWIVKITAYLAEFISWLTGKSFKAGRDAFESANSAAGGVAKNAGKIGKAVKRAAKEAQKLLLPFDQMNVLTKDTAKDGGTGGGGGAGAGAGAGGIGMTWPKEMDGIQAKFEKFRDLILLIGAAFAAWKLSKIASQLLGISRIKAFVGLTALITGITLLVTGIRDLIKNGPSVQNVCDIIAGALLTVGGAILLFTGATGLGLILIVIGAVVLAFKNLYQNCEPFRKLMNQIGRGIKGFFGGLKGVIKDAAKDMKKAFSGSGVFFKVLHTARKSLFKIGKYITLGLLKGMIWIFKKIGAWIKKHIFTPLVKGIKKQFGISSPAKKMLDIGKDIMRGVLEGMLEPLKKIGTWAKENILDPIKNALTGDEEETSIDIVAKFTDTKDTIKEKWEELQSGISSLSVAIKSKFEDTKASLAQKWNDIKEGIAETWTTIKSKFSETKESLKTKFSELVSGITEKTVNLFVDLKEKTSGVINKAKEIWGLAATTVKELVAKTSGSANFGTIASRIAEVWALKKKKAKVKLTASVTGWVTKHIGDLKKVVSFLKNVSGISSFERKATVTAKYDGPGSKTLDAITNAWSTLKKLGNLKKTATLTFVDQFKSAYNSIAKAIQNARAKYTVVRAILPDIKPLAEGAVIPPNKRFLAMLGDQKHGTNIETPLSTMVEAFSQALQANGYNGASNVNVYLQGDAKQLFKVVRVEADNYTQATGKAAFNL